MVIEPKNLNDEALITATGVLYRTTAFRIEFELSGSGIVSGLWINPFATESKRHWVKEDEQWGSTSDPDRGFEKIIKFALDNDYSRFESYLLYVR